MWNICGKSWCKLWYLSSLSLCAVILEWTRDLMCSLSLTQQIFSCNKFLNDQRLEFIFLCYGNSLLTFSSVERWAWYHSNTVQYCDSISKSKCFSCFVSQQTSNVHILIDLLVFVSWSAYLFRSFYLLVELHGKPNLYCLNWNYISLLGNVIASKIEVS